MSVIPALGMRRQEDFSESEASLRNLSQQTEQNRTKTNPAELKVQASKHPSAGGISQQMEGSRRMPEARAHLLSSLTSELTKPHQGAADSPSVGKRSPKPWELMQDRLPPQATEFNK